MTGQVWQGTSLLAALSNLRYELVPVAALYDEVRNLPLGARVTITSSPKLGIEHTVQAAENLAGMGYAAIPHLAARQVSGMAQLSGFIDRLVTAGVTDTVVLAGDAASPAGPFASALDLLVAIESIGRPFRDIGIAGYPEGHPRIAASDLQQALLAKAAYATYIVTQMCFSANAVKDWLVETRALGVHLPVYVGVPGKVSQKRLLAMASKVGVGDSLRFIRRNPGNMLRMMLAAEFDPEELMRDLEPLLSEPYPAVGFHVYTFNAVAATETWRLNLVQRLSHEPVEHGILD